MSNPFRRIVLASRPTGWVVPENSRLETLPIPSLGPNEVLVRNYYLSLDPYMRGRMNTRIDDGTHWVIHEQPARVNALIAQALDEAC